MNQPSARCFAIVYRLASPRLYDVDAWTDEENAVVGRHFDQLRKLLGQGKLVLAGRTLILDPEGFGIALLTGVDETEARAIMENDAAVTAGVMTAELFPFRIALSG
ncbi:MAG: hypothetical protein JXQ27_09335 [Acidobacteria bacterium]|nr:hypothetical protein [Acidobacteriota bacterium]